MMVSWRSGAFRPRVYAGVGGFKTGPGMATTSHPPQTRMFWRAFSIFRCCPNWGRKRQNWPRNGGRFWGIRDKRVCQSIGHNRKQTLHKIVLFAGRPQRKLGGTSVAKPSGNNSTNMLLEKMFHMSQPLAESKARLTSIQSYKRQLLMVTKAMVTSSKTVDFSFRSPLGFEARTTLFAVNCDSEDQFAFESASGNIEVMGLVDFTEIRPHCTELTRPIHYHIENPLLSWLDRYVPIVDKSANSDIR